MSSEAQESALARLLFVPVCDPSTSTRLDAVMEEIRVARLVAHMRPYLVSSACAATQPLRAVIPAQRGVANVIEQRRLADNARRRENTPRSAPPVRRQYPQTPYSGSTR